MNARGARSKGAKITETKHKGHVSSWTDCGRVGALGPDEAPVQD